jgi:ABC-type antimicrobial peptide transport system permease subunit
MWFGIRTSGNPTLLAHAIREAVRNVDPGLPLFGLTTQTQLANETLGNERLFATLSSFFGLLALLLVCLGLYGLMSFAVARRTNEIGIRMALGARGPDVTRMVMRETMVLVLAGACIGLAAAVATTRFIESMLFDLSPTDPATIAFGLVVMLAVAAVAGYLPARRASRIDPMTALRYE